MARRALLTALAAGALFAAGCGRADATGGHQTLRVWAFGAEGDALATVARQFEQANPGVRVRVQPIPWTAAHEKLLTAFVGGALPDVAQLGNTWIPEFSTLHALVPLDSFVEADSAAVPRGDYFPGIWATNVVDDTLYGIPWYVDTRVMFYRRDLFHDAGVDRPPTTWAGLRDALRQVKRVEPPGSFPALLPLDEWTQPVIFGLQAGSPLLVDDGTRGAFSQAAFRRGFAYYISLFRDGLAQPRTSTDIANLYQEFAAGRVAMYITGPWNVGEFKRRLPDSLQHAWMTAPMPGPDGPGVSLAGGSSIVIFRSSAQRALAWRFITFMSAPERQARFYERTGDLPTRRSAWGDSALAADPYLAAFRAQLTRLVATPPVPESEDIVNLVAAAGERAARGRQSIDASLAELDAQVDAILEKRRWMLAHGLIDTGTGPGRR